MKFPLFSPVQMVIFNVSFCRILLSTTHLRKSCFKLFPGLQFVYNTTASNFCSDNDHLYLSLSSIPKTTMSIVFNRDVALIKQPIRFSLKQRHGKYHRLSTGRNVGGGGGGGRGSISDRESC